MDFERTYRKILKSLLSEDIDYSRFNFRTDDFGSVLCDFVVVRDGNESGVFAKCMSDVFSFAITDKSGETKIYPEDKFEANWPLDFKSFKEAYDNYVEQEEEKKKTAEVTKSKVKPFQEFLRGDDGSSKGAEDLKVKNMKVIEKDGTSFIFGMLSRTETSMFYQCEFQEMDEDTEKFTMFKAAIFMKDKNSNVLKIKVFDDDGSLLDTLTLTDFKQSHKQLAIKFMSAIQEMEKWIEKFRQN